VTRREFIIKDDHVRNSLGCLLRQLLHFARADKSSGVGTFQPLHHLPHHPNAGGAGQLGQLVQRFLDGPIVIK